MQVRDMGTGLFCSGGNMAVGDRRVGTMPKTLRIQFHVSFISLKPFNSLSYAQTSPKLCSKISYVGYKNARVIQSFPHGHCWITKNLTD